VDTSARLSCCAQRFAKAEAPQRHAMPAFSAATACWSMRHVAGRVPRARCRASAMDAASCPARQRRRVVFVASWFAVCRTSKTGIDVSVALSPPTRAVSALNPEMARQAAVKARARWQAPRRQKVRVRGVRCSVCACAVKARQARWQRARKARAVCVRGKRCA